MKPIWLDRSPLATGVIRAGVFVYANQAFLDLADIPYDALIGQPFLERVAPEDRERMRDRYQRRVRGEQVPGAYEFTFLRGDGSRRMMEVWVTSLDGDVIFQLNDRTDRAVRQDKLAGLARVGAAVQSERTEGRIFATLARGLVELDVALVRLAPERDGGPEAGMRILSASAPRDQVARFEAMMGRPVNELTGVQGLAASAAWRDGSTYIDDMPLSAGRFLSGDPTALDVARTTLFTRGVILRVDVGGRAQELLLLMADWLLPDDLPACRLFGAQVSAALDLTRAQQRLVERERLAAIGELSAVVAHEVRNPLGVLFNSLGALRKILGPAAQGDAGSLLGIMDEETARLNHIIGDLLDFARPTRPALSRERLDAVVEEATSSAIGEARGRVRVVMEIGDLPLVPIDPRLMRQAVRNLVDNAVQAMPNGGVLTVRVVLDEIAGASHARVDVTDTGPGIARDVEHRIFEPFFTTRASGTGLGLALVKRIVEGHQGQLGVTSSEGQGTTFSIWLPMEEDSGRASQPDIVPPSRV